MGTTRERSRRNSRRFFVAKRKENSPPRAERSFRSRRDPSYQPALLTATVSQTLQMRSEVFTQVEAARSCVLREHANPYLGSTGVARIGLCSIEKPATEALSAVGCEDDQVGYQGVRARRVVQLREGLSGQHSDEANHFSS
jgi:hypothetical protein